ncbi:MAG: 16S rRNA (cytidine(1402)-2'-O)-methyltransferase [Patescibacteria group bacterium]|nr:16S rRNA (cytidine(1402)-2'-O)-methyltransferase [Patescibacteria group bacterium]
MLYIVATPIGNLQDVTLRALEILKESDFILCEDTRHSRIFLDHYQIKAPTISYHQHSKLSKMDYISELLQQDKNLALICDAGTPGISDPGNKLISHLIVQLPNLKIISIPGPAAVISALSISGFETDKFIFLGFPPHKKGRKTFFEQAAEFKYTLAFYESPYRILKALNELANLEDFKDREITVARELTKKFETIYRGTAENIINKIPKNEIKGEFVVVIRAKK